MTPPPNASPQPILPGVPDWIPMTVRKPTEKDANSDGDVWFWMPKHASHGAQRDCWDLGHGATHWMPDNDLGEQPQPPSK